MRHIWLRWCNIALLAVSVLAIGHFIYRWNEIHPRTVIEDSAPDCSEALDSDAHYLALICQAVIDVKGQLPKDPIEVSHVIADNAANLGFTWPNNFKTTPTGQICDCAGNPFDISVVSDRVSVTSEALYGYYFAELTGRRAGTANQ